MPEPSDHDVLIEIKTMLNGLLSRDDDKERRIRSLERSRAMLAGACGVLTALSASGLVTAVLAH